MNLLGAVTEYGEITILECGGSFTGEVTIRFLQHLQDEFGEKLVVILDQATYFTAEVVKNFASDESIELVYLPAGSPDLNPTEEYWRRFKQTLGNCSSLLVMSYEQQSGQHLKRSVHRESINISVREYSTAERTPDCTCLS